MSEAKVHSAAKSVRTATVMQDKRVVYKNVLGSPFILKWPTVHKDLGQATLTQLIQTLEPVGNYKKQCRAAKKERNKKAAEAVQIIEEPELHKRTHIGINEVTRFMENYIEKKQNNALSSNTTPVVYICKREIKPLQLCQHLLYMAALAQVKLVPMPAEAESKISSALGINRASVVLLELVENKEEALRLSANDIPYIDAPWLTSALNLSASYQNTNIKLLKTSAPIKKKPQQQQKQLKRKVQDEEADETSAKKVKA